MESVDRRCNWIAKRVREKSTAWGGVSRAVGGGEIVRGEFV